MTKIISGSKIADELLEKMKQELVDRERKPKLVVVTVGNDPASQVYIAHKAKAAEQIGVGLAVESVSEKGLGEMIERHNNDQMVDGIIAQLPLPEGIDVDKTLAMINPAKDVDGLHPYNIAMGEVWPPTAQAVDRLLKEGDLDYKSKRVVVVGQGRTAGEPISRLLASEGVEVITADIDTDDLAAVVGQGEIVISAAGVPDLINSEMVGGASGLVNVGLSRVDGKLVGDIDPECEELVEWWVPPVGGVGPLTVAYLMNNLVELSR